MSLIQSCKQSRINYLQRSYGGESGIRTHGRVSPTHAFQACSFNHSDISPFENQRLTVAQKSEFRDCDKSSNVPRSLTGFSSIAGPSLRGEMADTVNSSKLRMLAGLATPADATYMQ